MGRQRTAGKIRMVSPGTSTGSLTSASPTRTSDAVSVVPLVTANKTTHKVGPTVHFETHILKTLRTTVKLSI